MQSTLEHDTVGQDRIITITTDVPPLITSVRLREGETLEDAKSRAIKTSRSALSDEFLIADLATKVEAAIEQAFADEQDK